MKQTIKKYNLKGLPNGIDFAYLAYGLILRARDRLMHTPAPPVPNQNFVALHLLLTGPFITIR